MVRSTSCLDLGTWCRSTRSFSVPVRGERCRIVTSIGKDAPSGMFWPAAATFERNVMPGLDSRKGSALGRVGPHDLDLDRAAMHGHPLRILQANGQPPASPVEDCPVGDGQDRPGECRPIAEPLHGRDDDLFGKQPAVRHDPAGNRIASKVPAHRGQIALRE